MKIRSLLFVFLVVVLAGLTACSGKPGVDDELLVLDTTYGRIVIEFASNTAPKNVENYKGLAREGFYDGTKFHRIVKNKGRAVAIQGGDPNTIAGAPSTWGAGQPGQKTVPAERSGSKHQRGTVSAARRPNDPDSATSQFFICVGPEQLFDGQYSIFGRVIEGMNVVDSIARAPTDKAGELPIDPVVLKRAYIVKRNEIQ